MCVGCSFVHIIIGVSVVNICLLELRFGLVLSVVGSLVIWVCLAVLVVLVVLVVRCSVVFHKLSECVAASLVDIFVC